MFTFVDMKKISKKKEVAESIVRVKPSVKNKVAKKVAGTPQTIGEFYDEAAIEKLQSKVTDKKDY